MFGNNNCCNRIYIEVPFERGVAEEGREGLVAGMISGGCLGVDS